jgi:hypothetical protein
VSAFRDAFDNIAASSGEAAGDAKKPAAPT